MKNKPPFLTVAEAAAQAGVSPRRIRAVIAEGRLAAQMHGRDYLILPAALAAVTFHRKAGRPRKSEK